MPQTGSVPWGSSKGQGPESKATDPSGPSVDVSVEEVVGAEAVADVEEITELDVDVEPPRSSLCEQAEATIKREAKMRPDVRS